jgi:hypothetical protein
MQDNIFTEKTKQDFKDVLEKNRKEREKKKIKPVSCPICGKHGLKGIRSLSKHLHVEHENKSELAIQKALVNTIFGQNNVKNWLKILANKNISPEKKIEIPAPVKKLFNILKSKDLIDIIDKVKSASVKNIKKLDDVSGLNPLNVNSVISKLELLPKDLPIGVHIKQAGSISFLKDVLHYEGINFNKENTKGINSVLTKKIDLSKPLDKQILLSGKLLKFLNRPEVDSSEYIYIDSRNEGGSKLVKIKEVENGIIFEFEFDKEYYRKLIRNRVRELRKHKKIK